MIAASYLDRSANNQRRTDIEFADRVITKLSGELGNVAGIMNSISSVQHVLDDPYGDQLDSFAANSLENSPLIKALARYERIVANDLEEFVQNMGESGLYKFSVSGLTKEGKKAPIEQKSVYYPVTWRQPFSPLSAAMLGVDLSSTPEISQLIKEGELTNSLKITNKPDEWKFSHQSDYLLFLPTYYGRYVPDVTSDISLQSNGGVVVGINLQQYIEEREILLPGYDLQIAIDTAIPYGLNNQTTTLIKGDKDPDKRLSGIFQGFEQSWAPVPGDSSLKLTLYTHGGVDKKTLFNAANIAFATSILLYVIFLVWFQLKQRDAAHEADRETALTTLKAIGDAVITADEDGLITYVNPSAEALLARSSDEIVGAPISESLDYTATDSKKTLGQWELELNQAMETASQTNLPELQLLESSDRPIFLSSTVSPLGKTASGDASGHVIVMRDVTAERELTNELEFQATHDSLTGISNRYRFEYELKQLISAGNETKHAVCYIDLDQFKTINDTCGHSAGDRLLVKVTRDLESQLGNSDLLARLGGDEFGLIIKNRSESEAIKIAERVYEYFQTLYFQLEDDVFAVRASIGFVYMSGQFKNIEDVMAAADLACYTAKDHGRNELYIFDQKNDETSDRMSEMMWLPKLQMALRRDSFRLFAQPIVGIKGTKANEEKFEHYEVLLRLQTENGDLITPAQLIIAAERYNLMKDIDRWVISRAISFLSELQKKSGSRIPRLSINISGQSTTDPELPMFIKDQINEANIDPASLVFEITETAAITNLQSAVELVNFLHEMGCKVALDDFGSGVSSFGYLKTIPVDYIKIDGQFIKNIDTNEVDREMVKCMQAVANILGIELVAEFVETAGIVDVLRELDVDFAQGYYYCKPHPIEELLDFYVDRKAA